MTARMPIMTSAWRNVAIATYVGLNLGLILYSVRLGPHNTDWSLWSALPNAVMNGTIYDQIADIRFVWSPMAAWIMAGAATIGYWPWAGLHFGALWWLRWNPALVALAAVSWGFWVDVANGGVMTFVFVAGALALRGSRRGALVYLAFSILIPRPIHLPLAIWLVWNRPETRVPAAAMAAVSAAVTIGSRYAEPWIGAVVAQTDAGFNLGPSQFIGLWWLVIGVPLGVLLLYRGYVGWSGVVMSPYVMPYYLLMPLLDVAPLRALERRTAVNDRARPSE